MVRKYCGLRRNGTEGLWGDTEWDGGIVVLEVMGRTDCGVRSNGTDGL
jgi:hypothetical protein